ncbi:hypothetical protein V6N13_117377 [Hibiscus sabdariffa]|uniref:MHD1 domain-containing protein n=1 Tax=Hibiscus sabdariffa TaxID=183260 RepID=A0ABR2PAE7_9ROSI
MSLLFSSILFRFPPLSVSLITPECCHHNQQNLCSSPLPLYNKKCHRLSICYLSCRIAPTPISFVPEFSPPLPAFPSTPFSAMVRQSFREFFSPPLHHGASALNAATTSTSTSTSNDDDNNNMDLVWPFGKLENLDDGDIREAAYEIFFTACRSSPGFGGKSALSFNSSQDHQGKGDGGSSHSSRGPGLPGSSGGGRVNAGPTSRIKRTLGLKMLKRSPSRRMSMSTVGLNNVPTGYTPTTSPIHHAHVGSSSGSSYSPKRFSTMPPLRSPPSKSPPSKSPPSRSPPTRPRRPLTSAEIMRQQMRVTEACENRLRRTLMRTLVGQVGRRSETIILPLELLRHLKSSEFKDMQEYQFWQRRQLKILEAGLLNHPSIHIEKSNSLAVRLREIIRASDTKPIDTSKSSEMMRTLCNCVVSLAWRSANGSSSDVCHWADGFPLNIHIYISLLKAIFDIRDETLVLDEVDELLELMKKTWSTLGINRPIHNICFTWVLFQQYVVTNQMEPDLLGAAYNMLTEVATDAKKPDREASYVKLLSSMLVSMQKWAEKRLLHYHEYFNKQTIGGVENLLSLALSSMKILGEDVTIMEGEGNKKGDTMLVDSTTDRVDHYIRSSLKTAFAKITANENVRNATTGEGAEANEALLQLANETEELAMRERELFSPILKRWHLTATGVAVVTLHQCYGKVLKQYLAGMSILNNEAVVVLQRAARLEHVLVQMVLEDYEESEDGGKGIVREMMPYEVDSIIMKLLRQWIDERLKQGKELLSRAKETETWNAKSKSEPHAQSAAELMNIAKEMVNDFFEIPIGVTDDSVLDLAEGLEQLIQEYITFVASCGSKQSYLPSLPPLTRCNRDSRFFKLWRKANPCVVGVAGVKSFMVSEGEIPRPSTSRGTQRLYIRLNTLHYLTSHLHSLDKTLNLSPRVSMRNRSTRHRDNTSYSYFEHATTSIQLACDHISEVAAYRLIFLDSSPVFYDTLYVNGASNSRIKPAIRILKQNLTLLTSMLTDHAQALAMKDVMKASFEAFLMVLLARGTSRAFNRSDHEMFEEDFDGLKRVFCTCGEGLLSEDAVQREAEIVEGVISLMAQTTEQLIEDFAIAACETSGISSIGSGQKLPMPPTTGRWNRSDPNTILRVLCHRNDRAANSFLKKSFQLAKRK